MVATGAKEWTADVATIVEINGKRHDADCQCRDCRKARRTPVPPPKAPPRKRTQYEHGTPGCYRQGCERPECLAAWRKDKQDRRIRGGGPAKQATVTPLHSVPSAPEPVVGPMEQSVIDECSTLTAALERKSAVVQARVMARILDNDEQVGLWPTTSRQLSAIMDGLRGSSKKQARGRLAQVQKMVRPSDTKVVGR